jgi:hypothetical protein
MMLHDQAGGKQAPDRRRYGAAARIATDGAGVRVEPASTLLSREVARP